jgi:chorismate mutase
MARKKKPENETAEQAQIRQLLESVANKSLRSEKTSWNRKMNNMVSLIALIRPLEEQILDLMAQKMPIADDVALLRIEMVKECIHPIEQLVFKDTYIECKFCTRKIQTPGIS